MKKIEATLGVFSIDFLDVEIAKEFGAYCLLTGINPYDVRHSKKLYRFWILGRDNLSVVREFCEVFNYELKEILTVEGPLKISNLST